MLRRDAPQKQQEVLLTRKTAAEQRIRGAMLLRGFNLKIASCRGKLEQYVYFF